MCEARMVCQRRKCLNRAAAMICEMLLKFPKPICMGGGRGGPVNRFKLQGDKNLVRLTAFIRQVTMFMSQLPKIISVDTVLDFSLASTAVCTARIVFPQPKYSSATNCQAKTR